MVGPALVAAGIAGAAWAVRGRSSQLFGPSAWRAPGNRKSIALTFDDGPSPGTREILQLLAEHKLKATFFVCGLNAERHPDILRATVEQGHEIGNHSWSHPNCALRSRAFIQQEFAQAQGLIERTAGVTPSLLRAPYGVRWFGFRQTQRELGLTGVMWSVIGRDWKLPGPAIAKRLLSSVQAGDIICLHDGRGTLKNPDVSQTVQAVRRILPALIETGYHFETVTELLCLKKSPNRKMTN
jgi:peptidoglycan/xylan/chitin deacetylase (PgdA/CDA1 family)